MASSPRTTPHHDPRADAHARPHGGRHELGQNHLTDRRVVARLTHLVAGTAGPVVEFGPGDGALTAALAGLGRPVTAVELDPRRVRRLAARGLPDVRVVMDDVLRFRLPDTPHVVAGNVPFHLTTPILRRLLHARHWTDAVLLVQWEVARKRAGVGGATLMTASWWPWYSFELAGRVPASAFRPMPAVDGGILTMRRRPEPLVADRDGYQRLARQVFTGRGHGLGEILPRTGRLTGHAARAWLRAEGLAPTALPRQLTPAQWLSLWCRAGTSGPAQ